MLKKNGRSSGKPRRQSGLSPSAKQRPSSARSEADAIAAGAGRRVGTSSTRERERSAGTRRKGERQAGSNAAGAAPRGSENGVIAEVGTAARSSVIPSKPRPKLSSLLQSSAVTRNSSSGGGEDWRAAVQRYVKLFNRTESEQNARDLGDFVADEVHAERLLQRTERLRERDLLRGAIPAGSETKAELMRINESSGEVSVLVKLHVKRRMEQGGQFYLEERLESERLWLRQEGGEWAVLQVEPVVSERRPRYVTTRVQNEQEDDEGELEQKGEDLAGSAPFLNYELMPGFRRWKGGIPYRRDLAAAYADRWWNEGNPAFELFDVNCTNYVSQCIFAGNAPMNYTGRRESGWWYKGRAGSRENWSYSWAVANAMSVYLSAARKSGLRAELVSSADELQLGDVIAYDWGGDGRFQHTTIVTAFDSAGQPLVNANTVPSRHRYWDYRDSYAWTGGTRYRFFHIPDLL